LSAFSAEGRSLRHGEWLYVFPLCVLKFPLFFNPREGSLTILDDLYSIALREHRDEFKRVSAFIAACGQCQAAQISENGLIPEQVGTETGAWAAINALSHRMPCMLIDERARWHVSRALRDAYPKLGYATMSDLMDEFSAERVMALVEERKGQRSTWAFMEDRSAQRAF
jgi:hypothetical protein